MALLKVECWYLATAVDEGQRMSIDQYFQQMYNIRLRYPKLSCLQRNYLPIEVCHAMAGQKCLRNVMDKQVANMIARLPTTASARSSTSSARLASTRTRSPKASTGCGKAESGADDGSPAATSYSGEARESSRDGGWNVHSKRLNTPAQFKSWAVISMRDPNRCGLGEIQTFFKAMMAQMGQLVMGCPQTPC
ncbi:hypothetical protein PRIC1_011719 [Phytophthora ramorum]|nr:Protein argonaute-2 [Phytophthora ramorum]